MIKSQLEDKQLKSLKILIVEAIHS